MECGTPRDEEEELIQFFRTIGESLKKLGYNMTVVKKIPQE